MKRVVIYNMSQDVQDRTAERKKLSSLLEKSLRIIIPSLKEETEESNALKTAFQKIEATMPDLILEMRADITEKGNEFVREFFLFKKDWMMNYGETKRFTYYYEDHENLDGKIQVLENYGFVIEVTSGRVKKYRMTEKFVEYLTKTK